MAVTKRCETLQDASKWAKGNIRKNLEAKIETEFKWLTTGTDSCQLSNETWDSTDAGKLLTISQVIICAEAPLATKTAGK